MASPSKAQVTIRVQIFEDGEPKGSPMTLVGREAWLMRRLIETGKRGVSSLDHIGPRASHYTYKLRGYGFAIETRNEKHGGPYPGHHGRYVLHSDVRVLEDNTRTAA